MHSSSQVEKRRRNARVSFAGSSLKRSVRRLRMTNHKIRGNSSICTSLRAS